MASVEDLERKLSLLEQRLEAMQERLDQERVKRRGLLRDTHRCSVCDHGRILHVEWLQNQIADEKHKMPLSLDHKIGFFGVKFHGVVQLFVCEKCGYAETQIEDTTGLSEGNPNIKVLVAPEGPNEPYR